MGGEREFSTGGKTAAAPRPAVEVGLPPSPPPVSNQDQHVRIHENAGEVHFHVDSENLKAAVPVAVWYEAWQRLSTQPNESFVFSDQNNGTILTVQSVQVGGGLNQPDTLDMRIIVKRVNIGDTFAQLSKFSGYPGQIA